MFETIDDAALIDVIAAEAWARAVSDARKYAAIAELDVWVDAVDPGAVRRTRVRTHPRLHHRGRPRIGYHSGVGDGLFSTDAALLG